MWHLLNYIPPRGHSRSELPAIIRSFTGLELFAPTFVALSDSTSGQVKRVEKPLLYHYIFLRGSESDIKQLCLTRQGFSFVLDRDSRRHITLSDEAVEQFRIIARYFSGKLPCFPLQDINLEEGDKVQIVTGPCAGLTGTYISRKGSRSGNILVAVDAALAAVVYDVRADYVRVLEFSRNSRRVYDQLDAYADKLKPLLEEISPLPEVGDVPGGGVSPSIIFARRLGDTRISNPKLNARRQILLYAAYSILGDSPKAAEALASFRKLAHHVTNPRTRAFCEAILARFPHP